MNLSVSSIIIFYCHLLIITQFIHLNVTADSRIVIDQTEIVFSGVQGLCSDPIMSTITNIGDSPANQLVWKISGEHANSFRSMELKPFAIAPDQSMLVSFSFCPPTDQVGSMNAMASLYDAEGELLTSLNLYGLSAVGIEGPREPGLFAVLKTAGFPTDIGWESHHTNTKADLSGVEISEQRFKKAQPGGVRLKPIARYSPDFLLPFGYYRIAENQPVITPVGTLTLRTVTSFEHNCINPKLATGETVFDPGSEPFGVFTSSPTHLAYSKDADNAQFEPDHLVHAVRVFPAVNRKGDRIPNAYLICFEEASNGDYQDYVFLLENVIPVK